MARTIRKVDPVLADLATAVNDLKAHMIATTRTLAASATYVQGADPGAHNDKAETPLQAAAATTLDTSVTAVNEMLSWYAIHMADTLAHKVAGVALADYSFAYDLPTAVARANDIKAKYNVHRASTTYHYTADAANAVAAVDATDQASLNALLVEMKADLNLHGASGPAVASVRLVDA